LGISDGLDDQVVVFFCGVLVFQFYGNIGFGGSEVGTIDGNSSFYDRGGSGRGNVGNCGDVTVVVLEGLAVFGGSVYVYGY
jgi:hypothetical protein